MIIIVIKIVIKMIMIIIVVKIIIIVIIVTLLWASACMKINSHFLKKGKMVKIIPKMAHHQ